MTIPLVSNGRARLLGAGFVVVSLAGFSYAMANATLTDATQVEVSVGANGSLSGTGIGQSGAVTMTLVRPASGLHQGGEAVITIENYTQRKQQFILAKTALSADKLPAKLVDAVTPQDDPAIVDVSGVLPAAQRTISTGLPTVLPSTTTMHVYLEPGTRYLLFDTKGRSADRLALVLRPSPR